MTPPRPTLIEAVSALFDEMIHGFFDPANEGLSDDDLLKEYARRIERLAVEYSIDVAYLKNAFARKLDKVIADLEEP
jgi:hypothetical protein